MLIHPTVERLRSLGLAAMADTLVELQHNPEAAEMSHADWLGLLIDREATFRDNRRLSRRLTAAKLRQAATIENIDFRTSRGLDRSLFQTLATSQWVRDCNHLAIVGPTGTGKSWLACALGNKACRDGFSVLYKRAPRLFADLAQARGEGAKCPSPRLHCWGFFFHNTESESAGADGIRNASQYQLFRSGLCQPMALTLPVGERRLRQVPVSWAALRRTAPADGDHLLAARSKRNGVTRT
jgi:hypothetical protein